ETMGRQLQSAGSTLRQIGGQLSLAVTTPIMLAGGYAAKSATEMDTLVRALDSVTGSAEETARTLAVMREIARAPGLGFEEAVRGAVQLRVVGISARDAERAVREFGNAVARSGGGANELSRVLVQLAQSASVGRILMADWRPIIQTAPAVAQAMQ